MTLMEPSDHRRPFGQRGYRPVGLLREIRRPTWIGWAGPGKSSYRVQIRTITVRNGRLVLLDAGHQVQGRHAKDTFQCQDILPQLRHGHAACFKRYHGIVYRHTVKSPPMLADHRAFDQGRLLIDSCELVDEDGRMALSVPSTF